MSASRWTPALALMALAWALVGCGGGGEPPTEPPPEPETVAVTVDPTHQDTTVTGAELIDDATGSQLGTGRTTLEREEGTTLSVRVEADGFETTTATVSFNAPHTETIALTAVVPDSVEVTVDPVHEDSTVTGATLYDDATDEELGTGETTLTREEGATLSVRVEAEEFETATQSVSFESEHTEVIELTLSEPPQEMVTLIVSVVEASSGDELADAEIRVDGDSVGTGSINQEFPSEPGQREVSAVLEGYHDESVLISANKGHDIIFELAEMETADSVSVTVNPIHQDTTVTTAELIDDDTGTQLGTGQTTLTREEGTTLSVRVEADGFETATQSVSFNSSHTETIELTATQPTVRLQAAAIDSASGDPLADAVIRVDGDSLGTGSVDVELPEQASDRLVTAQLAGWRGDSVTVSGDEDHDLELSLTDVPACSDGIDNDNDGETDEDDPGCSGPSDDDESHVLRTTAITKFAGSVDNTQSVSSAESQRELLHARDIDFHRSIKVASEIFVTVENMREAGQSGEEFAMKLACGPDADNRDNVNTSDVAGDQGRDGWHEAGISGVDKSFFSSGADCQIFFVHGTKARGEPTGDGDDDVVFLIPDGENRSVVFQWFYEPDKVPEE